VEEVRALGHVTSVERRCVGIIGSYQSNRHGRFRALMADSNLKTSEDTTCCNAHSGLDQINRYDSRRALTADPYSKTSEDTNCPDDAGSKSRDD
jgi:hypothetical protein